MRKTIYAALGMLAWRLAKRIMRKRARGALRVLPR